jgi:hypothetical protein
VLKSADGPNMDSRNAHFYGNGGLSAVSCSQQLLLRPSRSSPIPILHVLAASPLSVRWLYPSLGYATLYRAPRTRQVAYATVVAYVQIAK